MKRLIITLFLVLMVTGSFVSAQMPITLPFYIRLADLITTDGTHEYSGFMGADVYANGSKSGAFTIDWRNGNCQTVTITGALLDITFTEPGTAGKCELWITQGDGDDTLDWTHEVNPEWPGGVAPTLSTGAADVDVIVFTFMGGATYRGIFNGDFQ